MRHACSSFTMRFGVQSALHGAAFFVFLRIASDSGLSVEQHLARADRTHIQTRVPYGTMVALSVLMLIGGIAALIAGGEAVVRGAVVVARQIGVPPLVVGLTLVAFGTSAPELGLNLVAAFNGNSGLSFGNVVGSNMANIGLVLGIAALISPLVIDASIIKRELPLMLLVSVVAALLCVVPQTDAASTGELGRFDAIGLLILFCVVLGVIVKAGGLDADTEAFSETAEAQASARAGRRRSVLIASGLMVFGLLLLVGGGWLAERGAVDIARSLGWSDDLIGLTVVAVATSLPELVTSIVAVRKGEVDIAVGNVVGSNIFNIALVLPATALVTPVPAPEGGMLALVVMLVLSVLLLPMARIGPKGGGGAALVSRVEALVLLGIYAGYLTWRVVSLQS